MSIALAACSPFPTQDASRQPSKSRYGYYTPLGRVTRLPQRTTAQHRERSQELALLDPLRPVCRRLRSRARASKRDMLVCAVAAMSFVVPQARRARERASGFVPRASGFVPRACEGQPEEPPFQVGQRVEGLFGAVCHTRLERRTSRLRARHSALVLTPLGLASNSRSWACLSAADGSRAT